MKAIPVRLPPHTPALLKMLDEALPHRCPGRGEDAEGVQRYAGQRELIDLLLSRLEEAGDDDERNDEQMTWIGNDNV